jgi:hypothetical protein
MNIQSVVRWNEYHPSNHQGTDPVCPVCGYSLGHRITLLVKDDKDVEHEIHAECLD